MLIRELLASFGLDVKDDTFKQADNAVNGVKNSINMLAGVLISSGIVVGFKSLIDRASAAEETVQALTSLFGEHQQSIVAWSDKMADSMGRSRYVLRTYAEQMGRVLSPMVDNAEAAAGMSAKMSELAVNMAAFYNTSEPEALDALRGALIGQTRSINLYNVAMNDARLSQFLLTQGITKSIKNMSVAEVTTARYNFLVHSLARTEGDAAASQTRYAHTVTGLKAQLGDLATSIGFKLLPTATRLLRFVIDAIKAFNKWREGTKIFETIILGATVALGAMAFMAGVVVVGKIGALGVALAKVVVGFNALGMAALLAQVKMFAIGLAVIALGALLFLVAEDFYQFFTGGESLVGKLLEKWEQFKASISERAIEPDAHWTIRLLDWIVKGIDELYGVWTNFESWWLADAREAFGKMKQLWTAWISEPLQHWKTALTEWIEWGKKEFEKIKSPIDLLALAWNAPIKIWRETVLRFFEWFAEKIKGMPVLGTVAQLATKGMSAASSAVMVDSGKSFIDGAGALLGMRSMNTGIAPPGFTQPQMNATIAPPNFAQPQAQTTSTTVNAPVKIDMNITQQPGQSGEDLAASISMQMRDILETDYKQALAATGAR
jgi:hypothetical protein